MDTDARTRAEVLVEALPYIRRFALPQDLDESKAVAKFTDGVLELTLPKKAAVTGRKLAIG